MRAPLLFLVFVAACGASGCPSESEHGYVLMNRRDHELTVTARRADACGPEADLSDPNLYGPEATLIIDAQTYRRMNELIGWQQPTLGDADSRCKAVWIHVEGGRDLVLSWVSEPYWFDDPGPYAIVFEGPRDKVALHLPEGLRELPAPR